jgi:hypothetical protein
MNNLNNIAAQLTLVDFQKFCHCISSLSCSGPASRAQVITGFLPAVLNAQRILLGFGSMIYLAIVHLVDILNTTDLVLYTALNFFCKQKPKRGRISASPLWFLSLILKYYDN